ncbi:MAG TPA: FecR domain-containing protein [Bacteroidales bacterium]|jgi:ferric-dicitrate binding protein FerR (iron transport regulator)|nr:FecR domain-containing protein [Bacteroidales bacterium]
MKLKKIPNGLFARKLLGITDHLDDQKFRQLTENDPGKLSEFQQMQKIWSEAERTKIFSQIDTDSDWKKITARITPYSFNYGRIPWNLYFLRIAALVVLTFGLSYGFYKLFLLNKDTESTGFTTYRTDNHKQDFILPDGSKITLNTASDLTYREGFGKSSREVILNGEAFFNVKHNPALPFRVYSGESIIEVTGTSFSVYQDDGEVHVSVLSGTVLVSSSDNKEEKISLTANQTAFLSNDDEIMVEDRVPVNVLSWKTGHLIFDETPIDSALMDIARHFRRNLEIGESLSERITAEFQDQPLHEILGELELVAGLEFDTTGTALIVRK